jgi:hypothetical protein
METNEIELYAKHTRCLNKVREVFKEIMESKINKDLANINIHTIGHPFNIDWKV